MYIGDRYYMPKWYLAVIILLAAVAVLIFLVGITITEWLGLEWLNGENMTFFASCSTAAYASFLGMFFSLLFSPAYVTKLPKKAK